MNALTRAVKNVWDGPTPKKKPNPWPTCQVCYHRRAPFDFCGRHPGIRMCVVCCPHNGNHPPRKDEDQ